MPSLEALDREGKPVYKLLAGQASTVQSFNHWLLIVAVEHGKRDEPEMECVVSLKCTLYFELVPPPKFNYLNFY